MQGRRGQRPADNVHYTSELSILFLPECQDGLGDLNRTALNSQNCEKACVKRLYEAHTMFAERRNVGERDNSEPLRGRLALRERVPSVLSQMCRSLEICWNLLSTGVQRASETVFFLYAWLL